MAPLYTPQMFDRQFTTTLSTLIVPTRIFQGLRFWDVPLYCEVYPLKSKNLARGWAKMSPLVDSRAAPTREACLRRLAALASLILAGRGPA